MCGKCVGKVGPKERFITLSRGPVSSDIFREQEEGVRESRKKRPGMR